MLVLILEDNADDALLMEKAVSEVGGPRTEVRVFDTGEAAIEHLRQVSQGDPSLDGVPDLLLVDLSLPQMSGYQFLEWLRGQEVLKEVPVVVFSAFQNLDADLASKLGVLAYCRKPEDIAKYVRILQRTVDVQVDNLGE